MDVNFRLLAGILLVVVYCAPAYAVLGLPQQTDRIGLEMGISRNSIDDPAGKTNPANGFQLLRAVYTDLRFGGRIWLESYYQVLSFNPDASHVGVVARHAGGRLMYQRHFSLTSAIKPWFGAGLDGSAIQYIKRHTRDQDGYLLQEYPNRLRPSVGLLLSMMQEWPINNEITVGGHLSQRISLFETMNETSFTTYLLYKY